MTTTLKHHPLVNTSHRDVRSLQFAYNLGRTHGRRLVLKLRMWHSKGGSLMSPHWPRILDETNEDTRDWAPCEGHAYSLGWYEAANDHEGHFAVEIAQERRWLSQTKPDFMVRVGLP